MRLAPLLLLSALPLLAQTYVRERLPELLSWDELNELGTIDPPSPQLGARMDALLTTAFLNNQAWFRGARPRVPEFTGLGPGLRVLVWNVERGLRVDDLIRLFTDQQAFLDRADSSDAIALRDLADYVEHVRAADLLVLNELDWGMKRTGYRELVRELGEALGMNWAYAVEFLEVDPVHLGTEGFSDAEAEESTRLREMLAVDRARFRGLHGTAVLSRYPILDAAAIPHRVQGYNWYHSEKEKVSRLEAGRRAASEKIFLETILREIRRGGRTLLLVTLAVDALPGGRLTVAAAHLENHCPPQQRLLQMREIFREIRAIPGPVILAGDLNTTLADAQPVTIQREIYKRVGSASFWAEHGLKWATGVGLAYDIISGGVNKVRNLNDPTARHVPIFAPNPEAALFEALERFRFDDGGGFDFRGDAFRGSGRSGTLANSNQRAAKGFETTYEVTRTVGPIGRFKLDWIFVKPYSGARPAPGHSYHFSPHFPRTLRDLNYSYQDRLSDHSPLTVDLPFR